MKSVCGIHKSYNYSLHTKTNDWQDYSFPLLFMINNYCCGCVYGQTYFGMEIDHKQRKASIIIHFVDKTMQVMIHFHLTPPLMFQYDPQLITVYSTTIMLVLCITALWISGDIDALHQLPLVIYIYRLYGIYSQVTLSGS